MIYAFLKLNNDAYSSDEQKIAIDNFILNNRFKDVQWIKDDYSRSYSQVYNLKRGLGSGCFAYSMKPGDILLVYNIYCLNYSCESCFYLVSVLLKNDVTIFFIQEGLKLTKQLEAGFSIAYKIRKAYSREREEKSFRKPPFPVLKKSFDYESIKKDLMDMFSISSLTRKYHTTYSTIIHFIEVIHPELNDIYLSHFGGRYSRVSPVRNMYKRALLPSRRKEVERTRAGLGKCE